MNLTPEKRNNLIKLGLITLVALSVLWFTLIAPAQERLSHKAAKLNDLSQKIVTKKKVIQQADQIAARLQVAAEGLHAIEDKMVAGDTLRWVIKTLREFETPHDIEFSKFDPAQAIDLNLPKSLSYKAVSFVVIGTGYYQNIGRFLANFENSHPYIRIHRLEIEPTGIPNVSDEKLSFVMEIHVLVKPSNPVSMTALAKPRA